MVPRLVMDDESPPCRRSHQHRDLEACGRRLGGRQTMDQLICFLGRGLVGLINLLPVRWVARLGRLGGGLVYFLDARHRRVTRKNLAQCFPEKSPAEILALARENFRRIGENFACAARTFSLTNEELSPYAEYVDMDRLLPKNGDSWPASRVVAIGHFGNFELYSRVGVTMPQFQRATTYRALRQPTLNRLVQSLRARSGCRFFERRHEGLALRTAMRANNLLLGLLADQSGGQRGLFLPFFGRECSCNPAAAVLALRYKVPLFTAFCFRTGLGRWRVEMGTEIPLHEHDQPRTVEAIMGDVNRAIETAVRRDPANWFWVHNRWKLSRPGAGPAAAATLPLHEPAH
jgi:KDO2-lipid IV(A) lauroyltransferase